MPPDIHVELRGVSRYFGGVAAVRDVDLTIERGIVHAIVGENGAGKSTISKLVSGELRPSSGSVVVAGEEVKFGSPRDARDVGITMIDQELALVPTRSVMANVFLGVEANHSGYLDFRAQRKRFAELVDETGFALDPDQQVGYLSVAEQQKVEILRAISRGAELIIMDEPTARLTMVESDQLYRVISQLTDRGVTIVYISHFLEEVLSIANTVSVMRDGRHVSTRPAAEETVTSLMTGMLGRSVDRMFPEPQGAVDAGPPILEVRELSTHTGVNGVSFTVGAGEIVGMAGLIGSGRTELARAIYGLDPISDGEILLHGEPGKLGSAHRAIQSRVAMLPESRKDEGLVMLRSVTDNIVMSRLDRVSSGGFFNKARRTAAARELMKQLDVRATGPGAPVSSLSGGNQQKVVFAKCLMCDPELLILDEPTRGVDVGAKRAIYELIVSLAAQGMGVLVISSELDEVMGLSHRILVMCQGRISAEMTRDEASEEALLAAAFGADAAWEPEPNNEY